MSLSNKCPGDADTAGLGTTHWQTLIWENKTYLEFSQSCYVHIAYMDSYILTQIKKTEKNVWYTHALHKVLQIEFFSFYFWR